MDQNSQNIVFDQGLKNPLTYLKFDTFCELLWQFIIYKMHILFFKKVLIILR